MIPTTAAGACSVRDVTSSTLPAGSMGSLPDRLHASVPAPSARVTCSQRFAITLTFANESIATILYGSESAPGVGKELIEVHSGGRSAALKDYRGLELRGRGRVKTIRDRNGDKGHGSQFRAFRQANG